MTTEINWIVPDRLVEITFSGELLTEDLMVVHRLELDKKTRPVYILANDYNIRLTVPEGALGVLDKTDGTNPKIAYVAFCGAPAMMEIFTRMLTKLMRISNKVTFFPTREQALAKLESMIAQES